MTNYEKIKSMSIEEMADFIGTKPFCEIENYGVDCVYGWHGCDCQEHAKRWLESDVKGREENA